MKGKSGLRLALFICRDSFIIALAYLMKTVLLFW